MIWSLNEVEAAGRKAARGVGLSWGLAEEAGRCARWLAERGLPGPVALTALLEAIDGADPATHAPRFSGGIWYAEPGPMSPLAAGAALWDRAELLPHGAPVRLGPCLWPVLLLPYAAWIAAARGATIALSWNGTTTASEPDGALHADPCAPDLRAAHAKAVELCDSAAPTCPALPRHPGADVPDDIAVRLDRLGHRTYAPATEQSRQSGAGAGPDDND